MQVTTGISWCTHVDILIEEMSPKPLSFSRLPIVDEPHSRTAWKKTKAILYALKRTSLCVRVTCSLLSNHILRLFEPVTNVKQGPTKEGICKTWLLACAGFGAPDAKPV